jgi:hypothetical protein
MTSDAQPNAQPLVHSTSRQLPYQEIVTPLSARALFWRPRFLCGSAFVHHLPFLFWLVDMLQPRAAVALGVGDGAGYFGLCQAMDKLGPEVRCHGIDPRPEAAGGPTREVRAYNEAQYADFSWLESADPRDLVHRFEDGSVDLMLVDMDLDPGLTHSLTHDWTRKLSDRAVILLHGTETRFGAGQGNGQGQGLLASLAQSCPTVRFAGGAGLAAVLYGADRLDRLERLADLGLGATGYAEVHHVFARLGAANHHEWLARTETGRAEAALAEAHAAEAALTEARDRLAESLAALDARRSADDTRAGQLAAVQARLFEVQSAHDARAAEMAAHAKALAQVEANALRDAAGRDAALIRERERAEAALARLAAAEAERAAAVAALEAERTRAVRAAEATASQLAVKDRALSLTTERLEAAQAAAQSAAQSATEARRTDAAAAEARIAALEAAHATALAEVRAEAAAAAKQAEQQAAQQARERAEERAAAEARLTATDAALTEAQATIARLTAEAEAQAAAHRAAQSAAESAAESAAQTAAQSAAEAAARIRAGEAALAEAHATIAALKGSLTAAPPEDPAAETRHFDEIRALTLRLESAQQEVLTLQKDLRTKADQSTRLRDLEAELQGSRAYVAELLASTSWRITGPMRKVVTTLRRNG